MSVQPYDEVGIAGPDLIIRRIDPIHHIVTDDNRNCRRISSKAYSPSSGENGGMSVDIEQLMIAANVESKAFVTSPPYIGSVAFTAQSLRDAGLRIGYDPIPNVNPYHGEVWGTEVKPSRFTGAQRKAISSSASWYVQIPDVELV